MAPRRTGGLRGSRVIVHGTHAVRIDDLLKAVATHAAGLLGEDPAGPPRA
ncbi:hypothetical protein [Streptomyces misionensis]